MVEVNEKVVQNKDGYLKEYASGIDKYIERLKSEGYEKRKEFMKDFAANISEYKEQYRKMLGIDAFGECDKKGEKTYICDNDLCSIYRIKIYITEEIPFYSILLVPKNVKSPMPLVIAQHGGGGTCELCCDLEGKNNYSHMATRALKRGAAILAPQLMLWAKEESDTSRGHKVDFDRHMSDRSLKHFGSSITALEISGITKSLDFALECDDFDKENVLMIGLSYGGYFTLHTMAADDRIKAGYAAGFFNDRNRYDWQDWCYQNSGNTFHDAEVAALCAPRKLFIQVGKGDKVFGFESAVSEAERAKEYYKAAGCEENFVFSLWNGEHTVSPDDTGYDFIFGSEINV